jgi:hypothetical protein
MTGVFSVAVMSSATPALAQGVEGGATGRVETAEGRAAAGAMVTADLGDGRTVTVYSDVRGEFVFALVLPRCNLPPALPV